MLDSVTKSIKNLELLINNNITSGMKPSEHLNHTQIQILVYLIKHKNEEVCQKDLQNETHLKKASITGALDSLEDRGAIKRIQSEDDKRKNLIVLSEKAINAKDKIEKRFEEIENKLKKGISKKDLDVFCEVLKQMERNLK